MDGTGRIAGAVIGEMILKGLAMTVAGGILLEGAALSGAKALKENQATASKVAKCVLAAIALVGALAATVGLGLSVTLFIGGFTSLVCEGLALPVGYLAGAAVALGTTLLHWKAFQWSGLVTRQGGLRDRAI